MSDPNPYQSYGQPPSYGQYGQYGGPPPVDPTKVNAPAIGLIVVGTINLLQAVFSLGMNLLGMNANAQRPPNMDPAVREIYEAIQPYEFAINVTVGSLGLLCSVVILLAGIQMLHRKMYSFCVTGSILAAIPCLSFLACCLIGEGVGIWALVVLMSADVKRSFE